MAARSEAAHGGHHFGHKEGRRSGSREKKKPSAKKEHDVMALAEPRQRETRKRTMAGEKISFFRPKMVAAIWRVN